MRHSFPFADLALARRIERAEGHANAAFVQSRAAVDPASGATLLDVGGTLALFDGVGSPLTQTFGLGVAETPTAMLMDTLEAFFLERGAGVMHEVSPTVDPSVLALLSSRGYHPIELTSVLVQPIDAASIAAGVAASTDVMVRRARDGEADHWAAVAASGWGESPEIVEFVRAMGEVSARAADTYAFFAESLGEPIATGSLHMHDGVAVLAGASTIPSARRRGAQNALLSARLAFAREQGCDLAVMGALPGSASQRNAERNGFRLAYTRIKWALGA
ncbi:GNAT family N-acetyltransferase [Gemmatimonas groenlandica]|uniref:GNAT family N-acetyltransferase n=1 Tax=Gemmatimonas groenlandica TaxID=2732249 RepID=A0A6M4IQG1_9BACT|nr:GNAT family N-acetyltransferase [Gemmatimonas groenlandica]QJR36375.1 GNAT family N-acetyltransferase [Gemmatimonas groenlandica]